MGRERFIQHRVRSNASHLRLESFFVYSVSGFVDRASRLVSDKVATHCAGTTDVAASTSEILKLDSQPILELLCAAERGVGVSTSSTET